MGGNDGRCRISGLVLLICLMILSATVANGIRTGVIDGTGTPGPAAAAQASTGVAAALVATAATTAPPDKAALDDPYKDSRRKVPNGPDPIHNRRARWGEAPARGEYRARDRNQPHKTADQRPNGEHTLKWNGRFHG